ncbi:MAG: hypothetical protein ACREX4_23320 [Gammaproteobacteria bacterium]
MARFLHETGHFSVEQNRVKFRGLMPAKDDNTTSVYVTDDLDDNQVWQLAQQYVEATRGPALARGELTPQDIATVGLALERDDTPPLHAAIIGWPPPSAKDEIKSKAQELAPKARLVVRERALPSS